MKKYLPYYLLLLGAFGIWYIKSHQRGPSPEPVTTSVEAQLRPVNDTTEAIGKLNRSTDHIVYSKHAHCRMDCRHITDSEVREVLHTGRLNAQKVKEDERGATYPLEATVDGHRLRIVFAPKGTDAVEVVTCIDLDKEWPCDCD